MNHTINVGDRVQTNFNELQRTGRVVHVWDYESQQQGTYKNCVVELDEPIKMAGEPYTEFDLITLFEGFLIKIGDGGKECVQ